MRFQARIPRFVASSLETGPEAARPVLDGSDVVLPNLWRLQPHTVALLGRPAVWTAFAITTPRIPLGIGALPPQHLRWEQDFGGHLFLAVTGADTSTVSILEAGPRYPNGTGALVPYWYPEDDFARRGIADFDPIVIPPPHGMDQKSFAALVRVAQRSYDGDQRYRAIEVPFLRVGRDSNSYTIGLLLSCGLDPRAIPKPHPDLRYEWTGYPGAVDPVHRANFGSYLGAPNRFEDAVEVAYHEADGRVRFVLVGGSPNARIRLPSGTEVTLDALGRIVFSSEDALAHGLPTRHTEPPRQIRERRRFPSDPQPAGAEITFVVDGNSVPLDAGTEYRGTIVERHDALELATLRTPAGSEIVLPLVDLGVELRDPKRLNRLVRVGAELTVGLQSDRYPKLVAHGDAAVADRLRPRRLHAPRPASVVAGAAVAAVVMLAAAAFLVWPGGD